MANQRRSANRRRKKRRSSGFLYKLLSVLLICAAIVAALTLFFKVETVEISGTVRYTPADITEIIPVEQGDNLFLLNKFSIASSITKNLPYVEAVRINRQLPDTLRIEVTECQAAAVLMYNGEGWLISPGGKIVETIAAADAAVYPKVTGCTVLEPAVGQWLQLEEEADHKELMSLLAAMEETGALNQLQSMDLSDASIITMAYGGRFTIELPRGADYVKKMQKVPLYISQLESNETGTFDMTQDGESYFIPYQ